MIIRSIILSVILLSFNALNSQAALFSIAAGTGQYFYRIYFTDKGDAGVNDFMPEDLLSTDAITRRVKCGADQLTSADLPVCADYTSQLTNMGLTLRCSSKWMNTALYCSDEAFNLSALESLPFVKKVITVKSPVKSAGSHPDKFENAFQLSDANTFSPIVPVAGIPLYLSGFDGSGVTIAVLDAGFGNADKVESLAGLISGGNILKTWDYVSDHGEVYLDHWHGTAVLSILAGSLQEVITGPASAANYLLFRTEDDDSEFPVEEDYWVAAAEYADSAGADIITSSLGYCTFDDPDLNYAYSDADGNTAFITIAADIAASKGILVVSSAGNERDSEWQRIVFPSDGDSVLCIGAVNQDLTISDFSSSGYSSDGRVKPDAVAPGVGLPLQYRPGTWQSASGTSFSCPVISGLCALLMQAVPDATAAEIRAAVRQSSDRFNNPDSLYGYGLPDFYVALKKLEDIHIYKPDIIATVGPNPFFDDITLIFREDPGSLSISLIDNLGNTIRKINYTTYIARAYSLTGLGSLNQGIYFLKVQTKKSSGVIKVLKLQR